MTATRSGSSLRNGIAAELSRAIFGNFTSPNVFDSNAEAANVVDVLNYIAASIDRLAGVHERGLAVLAEGHERGMALIAEALLAADEEGGK